MGAGAVNARILATLEQCSYSVLTKSDDLDQVYRLRYACYRAEKSNPKNDLGLMSDAFDESANCVHVAVEKDGAFLAAVRLHLVSELNVTSPTLEVFPEVLEADKAGPTMLDPTRFVVHPEARKERLLLHFAALRIPVLAAMFYDVDIVLAPVRSEHTAFYLRYLGSDVFASPRQYPGLKKPVGLLTASAKKVRDKVLGQNPYFGPIDSLPQSDIRFPSLRGVYAPSPHAVIEAA